MKSLSIVTFITPKFSFWNLARLIFSKPQDPSTEGESEFHSSIDPLFELNFFQDEADLENYLQSFRD